MTWLTCFLCLLLFIYRKRAVRETNVQQCNSISSKKKKNAQNHISRNMFRVSHNQLKFPFLFPARQEKHWTILKSNMTSFYWCIQSLIFSINQTAWKTFFNSRSPHDLERGDYLRVFGSQRKRQRVLEFSVALAPMCRVQISSLLLRITVGRQGTWNRAIFPSVDKFDTSGSLWCQVSPINNLKALTK